MGFKEFLNEINRELVSVYHVSPRSDMFKLRPISHRKGTRAFIGKGEPGIFVAPKFRDAVAWATSYIGFKKNDTQRPNERLKEKGGGRHGDSFKGVYKTLTVYEIKIPKDVLRSSVFTSWWEPEFFIQAFNMDLMTVVGSKTYSFYELAKIQSRQDRVRRDFHPQGDSRIISVSKTNLAAKYYLELKSRYNEYLLKGRSPVIVSVDRISDNDHLINVEIEKLKRYIFKQDFGDWKAVIIPSLDKKQESEVKQIYKRIASMIEGL